MSDFSVTRGNPTPEELAAVTAVLHATIAELTADEATRSAASTTAWQRSQRTLRSTLTPGPGAWRGFSA